MVFWAKNRFWGLIPLIHEKNPFLCLAQFRCFILHYTRKKVFFCIFWVAPTRNLLKAKVFARILSGVSQVKVACNSVERELVYTYDVLQKEQQRLDDVDAIFNLLNFAQFATFYSMDTAKFLRQRIIKEIYDYDNKKLKIKKINNKETHVISGPYTSVNSLKNDYIKLKNFGFEQLDIFINE